MTTFGIRALRKIQLGHENTAGTEANATTVWGGTGVLKDEQSIIPVAQDDGLLFPSNRVYVPNDGGVLTLDDTPATFEQIGYFLAGGVEDVTTGVADGGGAGTGKIYQYDVETSAAQAPQTFTIEMGDNVRQDVGLYGYCEEFHLSGAPDEAVMMGGTFRMRAVADGSFTASQTVPTNLEEILFNKGKLYIDTNTVGTTPVTETWIGFTLNTKTGHRPVHAADGNLYWPCIKQGPSEITGQLVMEHNATSETEVIAARAGTVRLVRMLFQGDSLTTAGTAYTYSTLNIDMAIQYTAVPELGEDDGDDVLNFPFRGVYVAAESLGAQFIVVNEDATLP